MPTICNECAFIYRPCAVLTYTNSYIPVPPGLYKCSHDAHKTFDVVVGPTMQLCRTVNDGECAYFEQAAEIRSQEPYNRRTSDVPLETRCAVPQKKNVWERFLTFLGVE